VSNGVYDTGGGLVYASQSNRVAIYKTVTVRSANNDPANTIIKGVWDSATNGPASMRCVYLINGASLIGFTLTNGATSTSGNGGGAYCGTLSILSNCVLTVNSAKLGSGAYRGKLYNCVLIANASPLSDGRGGAAHESTLYNCTLTNNSVILHGGGASASTLYGCTLIGNTAESNGGGVYNCSLYNCTLINNTAPFGGGARVGPLRNCTLIGNSAAGSGGGGALGGNLYNCLLIGNWVTGIGGGARAANLYNCTLSGNSSGGNGGGVYDGVLYNCVSWGNNKVDFGGTWYYSCALGITGEGTITSDPQFTANGSGYGASHVAGNYRLRNRSPCIDAGTNFSWMTNSVDVRSKDLDGRSRIDKFSRYVDMGCYERWDKATTFTIR